MEIQELKKSDNSKETVKYLADVEWLWLGNTKDYKEVKDFVALVCRDVTNASCINEICINDVLQALRQHGYEVVALCDHDNINACDSDDD